MWGDRSGAPVTVRRLMATVVLANLVVVVLVVLVGVISVRRSTDSVDFVTQRIQPTTQYNASVIQGVTVAERHVRQWGLAGDPADIRRYRDSLNSLSIDLRRLTNRDLGDPEVADLIAQQERAVQAWVADYGNVRVQREPGLRNADPALAQVGLDRINAVRAVNEQVDDRLTQLADNAREDAQGRLTTTLVALAALAVAGLVVTVLLARWVQHRLVGPLRELETTVARMTGGEHGTRARIKGPVEVQRVAGALNTLAEENQRAREVEGAIISQLQALDSIKSDFVSNVSHELRTPLTSISGYVEILEEELDDRLTEDEAEMLVATKRNVGRLRELIEDLLTLSRAERRGTDLQQVDLVALLGEVVKDAGISAAHRGVQIVLTTPDEPVMILADASQIARAITNLVTNAVKYSGGSTEVQVELTVEGTDAVLEVRDQGIGIPAGEMGELGSRFYRASNAVNLGISGTGLGLRIVQAILENHQASLEIASEQGVGTTARVRLPLQAHLAPVRSDGTGPRVLRGRGRTTAVTGDRAGDRDGGHDGTGSQLGDASLRDAGVDGARSDDADGNTRRG